MKDDFPCASVRIQIPPAVRIGGRGKEELLEALRENGVMINPIGLALFEHPGFTTKETSEIVEIACVSVAELGFSGGGIYQEIVHAASRARLVECPLELGPHLRLAFLQQQDGATARTPARHKAPPGAITVASAQLDDADATPKGFYLRCIEDVLWLRGFMSWPGHIWSGEDLFVFARHKAEA